MGTERKKAFIYLVITAVLWSIGGLFIKLVDWHPMAIAGARSGIAALIIRLYLKKPLTKPIGKLKLLGACAYAALVILFVIANKLTTAANAILLQFTAPIWVALFSGCFLKEKSRKSDWIAIAVIMFGMVLFFVGDFGNGNMIGNLVAVLSGIAMAAMVILLKLQGSDSPVEVSLLGNLFAFAVGLPFFFLSVPSLSSVSGLVILGVLQLGIPYIFYTAAIKHVTAIEAILIPIIEPLLNPVWVFLVTGESPGVYAFAGGTIVITTIIIRGVYQSRSSVAE